MEFNKLVTKDCYVIYDDKSDKIALSYFDSKNDYKYFKKFIEKLK